MNKLANPSRSFLLAAVAGIASAILQLIALYFYPNTVLSFYSPKPELPPLWLGITGLILYACYMYGFALLGRHLRKPWIEWAAYWVIGQAFLTAAISELYPQVIGTQTVLLVAYGIINSAAVVIVGWSVMRLHKNFGPVGVWYGIFAMLSGTGIALVLFGAYGDAVNSVLAFALGSIVLYRQWLKRAQ